MASRLRELAQSAGGSVERLAEELFAVREIFGDDLPRDLRFTGVVTKGLKSLYEKGAHRTVSNLPG
jgi:fructuronate reductase